MADTAKEKALKDLVKIIREMDNKSMALDVLNSRQLVTEARLNLFKVIENNGYELEATTYKLIKKKAKFAKIRKDLLGKERVPVGNTYYGEATPLPYRWVNENDEENADSDFFQVYLDGSWQEAESVDWEF